MKEEDAKTKMCPFIVIEFGGENGGSGTIRCMASGCMAWEAAWPDFGETQEHFIAWRDKLMADPNCTLKPNEMTDELFEQSDEWKAVLANLDGDCRRLRLRG